MLAYAVDTETCVLTRLDESVMLPANVQYACPTASGQHLLVISSDGGPGVAGNLHYLTSFAIDGGSGALRRLGADVSLRQRPIHITTDIPSEHLLITYNDPSVVSVHRILPDGSVGAEVEQPRGLDTGIYAHEVRVVPSNDAAILVARGNDPSDGKPEDPGALKVFNYRSGVLENGLSVAPGGGCGFGPRNVDLDTAHDRVYVSLERQNRLASFRCHGASIAPEPSFQCGTLDDPDHVRPLQLLGVVRVHPNGRFVYVANRAFGTTEDDGRQVFAGGENTMVVYEVDDLTGEPHRIQSVDTDGIYPRTFSIDASGSMLIVGNARSMLVKSGTTVRRTSANLSAFAIGADGRLRHERTYEVGDGDAQLFWSGLA